MADNGSTGHNTNWPLAQTIVLFLVSSIVLGWPWLSGSATIPWDAKAHFLPHLQFLAQSFHAGQSPFWNPYIFSGSPQIADPQSLIFSLPFLLVALFDASPTAYVLDCTVLGMQTIGGVGILLFFRERRWFWGGALIAAIIFVHGGSAAWRVQHVGQIISLAWWPISLWLLERTISRGGLANGIALGFIAAMMALGRDQVAWLGLWLLAAYAVSRLVESPERTEKFKRVFLPLSAAALVFLLLTLIPVSLSALLVEHSTRAGLDYEAAARGSLHPSALLTLLVPNLFGSDGPFLEFWGAPSAIWADTGLFLARNMSVLYLGSLPVLALLGWGMLRGFALAKEVRILTFLVVLTLLYALGRYTPVFEVLHASLPGAGLFRRAADATFFISTLAAILAGWILGRVLDGSARPLGRSSQKIAGIILLLIFATSLLVAFAFGQLDKAIIPILLAVATMLISLVALRLVDTRSAWHSTLSVILLAGVLTVDLGVHNGPSESTALPPADFAMLDQHGTNETIQFLKARIAAAATADRRDRVELAGLGFAWPNASMTHRLENTLGYNPVRLDDYAKATGAGDTVAEPGQRQFSALMPSYDSHLADLLGLRYIVTGVDIEKIDPKLTEDALLLLAQTPDGLIYENPDALPRVMIVAKAQSVDQDGLIRTGEWPAGFDPKETVLLDPGVAGIVPAVTVDQASGKPHAEASAVIRDYQTTEIVVQTKSDHQGYLLLNDVWHPWWFAEIDGAPAPVLRANGLFRAVALPQGEHEIRFRFRPFLGAWSQISGSIGGSTPN